MIDLAKEIRRRAPAEDKPSIKMANPELFTELGKLYQRTNDAVMKALIKEICELAGEPWSNVLTSPEEKTETVVQTYRGSTLFSQKPETIKTEKPAVPKRIYRGQVVQS
jgi:hypothetical protein